MFGKPLIAIDIDGTMCKTHKWMIEHASKNGLNPDLKKYCSKGFFKTPEERADFESGVMGCFDTMEIYEEASEIINELHKNYEIAIVTSRNPLNVSSTTIEWLERNKVKYDSLHMVGCMNKKLQLMPLNPIIVIEDEPVLLESLFGTFITIKMNHSYNSETPSNYSCDNWKQILECINHITCGLYQRATNN